MDKKKMGENILEIFVKWILFYLFLSYSRICVLKANLTNTWISAHTGLQRMSSGKAGATGATFLPSLTRLGWVYSPGMVLTSKAELATAKPLESQLGPHTVLLLHTLLTRGRNKGSPESDGGGMVSISWLRKLQSHTGKWCGNREGWKLWPLLQYVTVKESHWGVLIRELV